VQADPSRGAATQKNSAACRENLRGITHRHRPGANGGLADVTRFEEMFRRSLRSKAVRDDNLDG